MSKLFFGGLPTDPDVRKLDEAFPAIKVGDEIAYTRIEELIGAPHLSNRFRSVTLAWRRKKLNEGIELEPVRGESLRCLSMSERFDSAKKGVWSGLRKQVRSINRCDRADLSDDPVRLKQQETLHRYGLAVRDEAMRVRKQIEPPRPTDPLPRPR